MSNSVRLAIEGMTCASCVNSVEQALNGTPGILSAHVNLVYGRANLQIDSDQFSLSAAIRAVQKAGYGVLTYTIDILIEGIEDSSGASALEAGIGSVSGVASTTFDPISKRVSVELVAGIGQASSVLGYVKDAGYRLPIDMDPGGFHVSSMPWDRRGSEGIMYLRNRLLVAIALTGLVLFGSFRHIFLPSFPEFVSNHYFLLLLTTPVQFWAGWYFYSHGLTPLRYRTVNMYTLIAIGTSVAYFYSCVVSVFPELFASDGHGHGTFFHTAAAITTVILLGRYMEAKARDRISKTIPSLITSHSQTFSVIQNNAEIDIPIDQIIPGDIVLIRPGEEIPADGELIAGVSTLNESILTGESAPIHKVKGSRVYASTVNMTGSFKFCVTEVGKNTVRTKIIKLVEESLDSKAPIQHLADVVSGYFVPTVLVVAILAFMLWLFIGPEPVFAHAMLAAVSILIIACPCALGLATPTAMMVGIGKGVDHGLLVRNAEVLEQASKIDTIILDKTGTLTMGMPMVTEIFSVGMDKVELLTLAASIEQHSEHPIGQAIVAEAKKHEMSLRDSEDFLALPGQGVQARLHGNIVRIGNVDFLNNEGISLGTLKQAMVERMSSNPVVVAVDGCAVGIICIENTIKPEATAVITNLKRLGLSVVMLTGDNPYAARTAARALGIKNVLDSVSPAQKSVYVKELQRDGRVVAMVGDGVNDAPALAQADIGIAIGTGTNLAIQTSGVILIRDSLWGIVDVVRLSRATLNTVRQNLFWAFCYNILLIPVAAGILYLIFNQGVPEGFLRIFLGEFGFISPVLAASAMAVSSVSVIMNSLRLKRFKGSVI